MYVRAYFKHPSVVPGMLGAQRPHKHWQATPQATFSSPACFFASTAAFTLANRGSTAPLIFSTLGSANSQTALYLASHLPSAVSLFPSLLPPWPPSPFPFHPSSPSPIQLNLRFSELSNLSGFGFLELIDLVGLGVVQKCLGVSNKLFEPPDIISLISKNILDVARNVAFQGIKNNWFGNQLKFADLACEISLGDH